jgi:hypothetical protein
MQQQSALILLAALAVAACDASSTGDRQASTSRHGAFTLSSLVDGEVINTEIHRDGELVAIASTDEEQLVISWFSGDLELSSEPPADYAPAGDISRYHAMIADVGATLEPDAGEVEFRVAGCGAEAGYIEGHYCVHSWCSGGCEAIDCGPSSTSTFEMHFISDACFS